MLSSIENLLAATIIAVIGLGVDGAARTPASVADSIVFSQGDFRISRRDTLNGQWIYTLADTAHGSFIAVHQKGATIKNFVVTLHGTRYAIFNTTYGDPKMMPWPNRTKGATFTDANNVARNLFQKDSSGNLMTLNDGSGNAMHGMVMDRPWQVEGFGVDAEGAYIICYFDTQGYPVISGIFGEFRDYTVYRLAAGRLVIDCHTVNKSSTVFTACGWGWHPYVNAPIKPLGAPQTSNKTRCKLLFPADSIALTDATKIPTGEMRAVGTYQSGYYDFTSLRTIGGVNVDHFFTALTPLNGLGFTRSVYIDYANRVRVQYLSQYPFYSWMVLFIPTTWLGNVVCVEHQTEEVNGLNTKQHLISIPPAASSDTGRIIIAVDADTTLAFNALLSIRDGGGFGNPARPDVNELSVHGMTFTYSIVAPQELLRLTIYRLDGSVVRSFKRRHQQPGSYTLTWDGADATAHRVAAGLYVAAATNAGRRAYAKVAVPK